MQAASKSSKGPRLDPSICTTEETRRAFFGALIAGGGAIALSSLAGCEGQSGAAPAEREGSDDALETTLQALTGTGFRWCDTAAELRTLAPSSPPVVVLRGYYAPGDGGGGIFIWSSTAAIDDSGLVFNALVGGVPNPAPASGFRRLWEGQHLYARWFGVKADGTTDDTVAIQRALLALNSSTGGTVYLPAGNMVISATLTPRYCTTVHGSVTAPGTIGTALFWNGPTNGVMMRITSQTRLVGLGFACKPAKIAYCGVQWVNGPGQSQSATRCSMEDCLFSADSADPATGLRWGLNIGGKDNGDVGNIEDGHFTRCAFFNQIEGAVLIDEGQPYNTVFEHCTFANYRGPAVASPTFGAIKAGYGVGVQIAQGSCSAFMTNCVFSYLEVGINAINTCHIDLYSSDSEHCKKLLWHPNGVYDGNDMHWTITGGRHATMNVDAPSANFLASDVDYIALLSGASLTINGASFGEAQGPFPWKIFALWGAHIIANSTLFPNNDPVYRSGAIVPGSPCGKTIITGHARVTAGLKLIYPIYRFGRDRNADGQVTLSGAATSAAVTFPNAEVTSDYNVALEYVNVSTGAVVGSLYPSAVSVGGFTVNASAAPGAGQSLVVRWRIS